MSRINLPVLGAIGLMAGGALMPALAMQRNDANRTRSMSNLKEIGLGFHGYVEKIGCLPHNGGINQADRLASVNYGWHHKDVEWSGTWATAILPYMDQDAIFKAASLKGVEPPMLPVYPAESAWQLTIRQYLCTERGRNGVKSEMNNGCFPGPVIDFALNAFVNAPPQDHTPYGFARGEFKPGTNGDWAAAQAKMTVQGINDGSSNTILVGGKALPPGTKDASNGDEGIFSPGNWSINGNVKTLVSTGTARGHVVVKDPPAELLKENPKEGGVPWMYADSELTGAMPPASANAWGGPFAEGVLFMFGDGSVRMIKYTQRGSVNFARMLYPSDGAVINND